MCVVLLEAGNAKKSASVAPTQAFLAWKTTLECHHRLLFGVCVFVCLVCFANL